MANRLYPWLSELIGVYAELQGILEKKRDFDKYLPKRIVGIDIKKRRLIEELEEGHEKSLREAAKFIQMLLPYVKETIEEGRQLYEFIEGEITIERLGLESLAKDCGLCIVNDYSSRQRHAYTYRLTVFSSASDRFRKLSTTHQGSFPLLGLGNTPEEVKTKVMHRLGQCSMPAAFLVEADLSFPFEETIFPVAKRKLIEHISKAA